MEVIEFDRCLKCGEPLRIAIDRPFGSFVIEAALSCPSDHGVDGTGENIRGRLVEPMGAALIGLSYVDAIRRAMQKPLADFRERHETQKEIGND